MRKTLHLLLFTLTSLSGNYIHAQGYNPLAPPNTYQNADNPNYWQNKMPFEGYWQQDVHYTIKAKIDEKDDIITGVETLVYTNNSPDNLTEVYFHLYQNAFTPGSYADALKKTNNWEANYGKHGNKGLGTTISKLEVNGKALKTVLDNTILKVFLDQPLRSGESITFNIDFKTYFRPNMGRMKMYKAWGYKHYNVVHWYPRISVYDRKFGWTTDQHLGHEFYGDFGTFDVELDFANNFVVDATGYLQNRSQVLPKDLRQKLDIKNFVEKPYNSPPSEIIPYDPNVRKTWKFHAENVHDFAFTADPTYRIGEAIWNGISCIALAQEPHASKWQNAAEYAAKVIQVYSEDIGMYTYHKMIVADARDGMEYPMLTLDGGSDPGYRGLLAHEIGHNWFFGQIGNNEAYRAMLDEGFTQFLTAWSLIKIDGDTMVDPISSSKYKEKFKNPRMVRDARVYRSYLRDALRHEDPTLNTHSDEYAIPLSSPEGGYRHVYYKTATMLYNLQYVLGDELFLDAMKHYFKTWKIAHPYMEDFRTSMIQYTKVDLNWFFDQWMESTKTLDYAVGSIKEGEGENEYLITFKRKGEMQMPIDFTVISKDKKETHFYIPNTWFEKETDAIVLPKWTGWGELNPTYIAKVTVENGISDVVIDQSGRLADAYQLNNSKKFNITSKLDSRINNASDFRNYELFVRPEVWWNGFDGLKTGIHLNGDYMKYKHQFDLTLWANTGIGQYLETSAQNNSFQQFSYRFNYKTGIEKFIKRGNLMASAAWMDGLEIYTFGLDKRSRTNKTRLYGYFKSMFRKNPDAATYLLYPLEWNLNQYNNTFNSGFDHSYAYMKGNGKINLNLRSSSLGSDCDYAQLSLEVINRNRIKKLNLNTRFFVQYGTGGSVPAESSLFLSGANPEELMDNKYTRAVGFFDYGWLGYGSDVNHFHGGGGLNLRGYAGYLAPYNDKNGVTQFTYRGNSGASVNAELEFQNWINWKPKAFRNWLKLDTYLFTDAGFINVQANTNELEFSRLRADAGLGFAMTVKKFGTLEKVNPLTIRFDMPFFLNATPAISPDYLAMRWVVGINRAF